MKTVNLSCQNTIINQYVAETRDAQYQQNRPLFRRNMRRIGWLMAYEISKTLHYKATDVRTPLGTAIVNMPADDIVIATVLRAGLPFHEGFLDVFDHAENAFVSAYRLYTNSEHTEIGIKSEYMAAPTLDGKTLIIADPMLATGGSMTATYEALTRNGTPATVHIASVIATNEGITTVSKAVPDTTTVWCAAIDGGMNEHKYIVPGFGDAGDLCFGAKI